MSAPPWTRAPAGTSVGTCRFSSRRRTATTWISATRDGHTAVSDARPPRRRQLLGPARHHRAKPAHPPRRHDAPTTRHTSHTTRSGTSQLSFGHKDVGVDMLRHIIAAAGDPGGLNRSDKRSSPPTRPPVHPFPYTTRVTAGRAAAMRSGGYDTRTSGELQRHHQGRQPTQ